MKRIAILVVMVLLSFEVSARSVHYFTYSQAVRTVSYLNAQNEMMIYFGYEYEIPTYVLINEVWMERVNSAYYELWVYGYDAYTGDEIYMPLDLEGVWLYSAGRMYNAAQYLRFRVEVIRPSLSWYIPPYRPFTRVIHRHGYVRTYHYNIHRHGWMPPAYTYGPGMPPPPLPYYYMRHPSAPAPMPTSTWTPGSERPIVNTPEQTRDHNPSTGTPVRSSHTSGTSTSTNRSTGGCRGGTATETPTSRSTAGSRGTTETRSTTETRGSSTRGTSETRGTSTRGTSETRGTNSRSTTETRGGTTETRNTTATRGATETRSTTPTRSTVESRSSSSTRTAEPSSSESRSSSSTRSSSRSTTNRGTTSETRSSNSRSTGTTTRTR